MAEQRALTTAQDDSAALIERVVIGGDLSKLTPEQRVRYYRETCQSLGLNYLTQPFQYITLNGKLTLYARKDATDQLRRLHDISIDKPDIRFEDDWIIVTVSGHDKTGRSDADVGVVSRKDMRGDFGNALMKAVTKAKRRLTLSIVGLGWLDETEIETIPDARPANVNTDTGEIVDAPSSSAKAGTNGDDAARPGGWSKADQSRFRETVTFSKAMSGMGISRKELLRLVPEVREPETYGAYAVLGTVDEAIALVKERLVAEADREREAQELSDAADAERE